jgi:hypothetical protein
MGGKIKNMNYAKSLLAVLATAVTAIVAAMTDNTITDVEWINVGIAAAGAAAVFAAPNVPGARFTKFILSAITAILVFFASAVTDGVSGAEWLQALIVALGAVGVYAVPNRPVGPDAL